MSRTKRYKFEVCANSIQSALHAEAGGADRVEICQNLPVGGITPSYGLIRAVKQSLTIPVHVLIRPRGGNFVYTCAEFDIMISDVQICHDLSVDGIVVGILDHNHRVDVERMKRIMQVAAPMQVTFHRAFDQVVDMAESLEAIVDLGCSRILTVGGPHKNVYSNVQGLAELVKLARDRIIVMPGGGVEISTLSDVVKTTRAIEYHGSARRATFDMSRDDKTDERTVRKIVVRLEELDYEANTRQSSVFQ